MAGEKRREYDDQVSSKSAVLLALLLLPCSRLWAAERADDRPIRYPVIVHADDFLARILGEEVVDDRRVVVMEAVAKDPRTAQAVGYARIKAWVDAERLVYRKMLFWGADGRVVTTVEILRAEGPRREERFQVTDHSTGRTTVLATERPRDGADPGAHPFPLDF